MTFGGYSELNAEADLDIQRYRRTHRGADEARCPTGPNRLQGCRVWRTAYRPLVRALAADTVEVGSARPDRPLRNERVGLNVRFIGPDHDLAPAESETGPSRARIGGADEGHPGLVHLVG